MEGVWNSYKCVLTVLATEGPTLMAGSCSAFRRMHSTRLSSSLQEIVWMLMGRESSWTFLEKRSTARER